MSRVRRGFLLAAGLGTRLKPFSLRLPKPAWPFFNLPIAAHQLHAMARAGVERAVVNLHHLPDELVEALAPHLPEGLEVEYSREEDILGTGGALAPWRGELGDEDFFLVNADTYRELDLAGVARLHADREAVATLTVEPLPEGVKGPLEIDESGRIVRLLDAVAPIAAGPTTQCEFTGVHVIGPGVWDRLGGVAERKFCIISQVHKQLVDSGAPLYGFVPGGGAFWSDLGTPTRYIDGHRALLESGRLPPAAAGEFVTEDRTTPQGGRLLAPSFIGEGAVVGSGAVAGPCAVLGAGSRVAAGGRVADSVLWDGATANGEISRCVVAPWGEILEGGE